MYSAHRGACVCVQNITYQSYCACLVRDFPRPPAFLCGLVSTLRDRERERERELFWVSKHRGMRAEGWARRKWGIQHIENKQGRAAQRLARTFTSPSRWNPPFLLCPRSYFPLFLYLLASCIFLNTCFRFPPLLLFSYDLYYDFCSFFSPLSLPLASLSRSLCENLTLASDAWACLPHWLTWKPNIYLWGLCHSHAAISTKKHPLIASIIGFYSWQWILSLWRTSACMLNTCATSRVRLWCLLCR